MFVEPLVEALGVEGVPAESHLDHICFLNGAKTDHTISIIDLLLFAGKSILAGLFLQVIDYSFERDSREEGLDFIQAQMYGVAFYNTFMHVRYGLDLWLRVLHSLYQAENNNH